LKFAWTIVLCGTILLLGSPGVQADVYKRVNPDGSVTFTDTPTDTNWQLYFSRDSTIFDVVRFFAEQFGLEDALVRAVIKVESDYNPTAISHRGAMGMMQLIPTTAAELNVVNPLDMVDNIRGGSLYLRQMLDRFGGNLDLALAAYNAGPGAVSRYGGIPPFKETRNYVRKVKMYLDKYRVEEDSLL